MFKQYLYFILLCAIYNAKCVSSTNTTAYAEGISQNKTILKLANSSNTNTHSILTEGGTINITKTIAHHEREHAQATTIKAIVANQTISTLKQIIVNNTSIINATNVASTATIANATITVNTTQSTYPMDVNGDSKIKPRKGVNMSEATTVDKSTTPATTTTFVPRKPTVTFGSDDDPAPAKQSANTRVIMNNKIIAPNKTVEKPSPVEDEVIGSPRFSKRHPDYVLPIVLTILAVPLLAIILTVLWKRGAEWWYHRHYRRMDFLIDGMYNN